MPDIDDPSIETRILDPANRSVTAEGVDPDVWAVAAGDEYATEWAIERTDETVVLVETYRRKGDRFERDGEPIAYDLSQDLETADWASQFAGRNPAEKVAAAREYFGN
ncbi:MAG: hypothetical protein ABEJ60_04550 [Halodesulfurarchaeum sp.]